MGPYRLDDRNLKGFVHLAMLGMASDGRETCLCIGARVSVDSVVCHAEIFEGFFVLAHQGSICRLCSKIDYGSK